MIPRRTWQDSELGESKDPSRIGNNVLKRLGNSRRSIFLPLEQSFLMCFPETSVFSRHPFLHFGDRCKSKGFLDARERKRNRAFARTYPFTNSFYSTTLTCTMHLSRLQYLCAISLPNPPVNSIYFIVLPHLPKIHLVELNEGRF